MSNLLWSSSNRIAYVVYRGQEPALFTVNPDGSDQKLIPSGTGNSNYAWSPDGTQLLTRGAGTLSSS